MQDSWLWQRKKNIPKGLFPIFKQKIYFILGLEISGTFPIYNAVILQNKSN